MRTSACRESPAPTLTRRSAVGSARTTARPIRRRPRRRRHREAQIEPMTRTAGSTATPMTRSVRGTRRSQRSESGSVGASPSWRRTAAASSERCRRPGRAGIHPGRVMCPPGRHGRMLGGAGKSKRGEDVERVHGAGPAAAQRCRAGGGGGVLRPEALGAYEALGFDASPAADADGVARPELKSYFTSRSACMGQVPGEVVATAFGCFEPAGRRRCGHRRMADRRPRRPS